MDVINNMDCIDFLHQIPYVSLIFMDPPDNIGLEYDGYKDERPDYYDWLDLVIRTAIPKTDTLWISYYWKHDLEIKYRLRYYMKERPTLKAKTFIWRFTFGQYRENDCGSGFRFLLRITKPSAKIRTDKIRQPSTRMMMGDSRASGLRVPDDVWEFPRVVGNSEERKPWHPTQHPENLLKRIILMSTDEGDMVADPFGGTGTTLRSAVALNRHCLISEISEKYCKKIRDDTFSTT